VRSGPAPTTSSCQVRARWSPMAATTVSTPFSGTSAPIDSRTGPSGSRPKRRRAAVRAAGDRKSTRLNSSHVKTSYAVVCVQKRKAFLATDEYAAYLQEVEPLVSGPPQVTALTLVWV